ncbi:MAG: hypothetical protein M3Y42_08205 [Actinomycetota bacterium]|nr:hypothetical protein [Actinomycetota bacterium]MDQ2956931.1 hypothetical protein [Actinomycetota bacterium]
MAEPSVSETPPSTVRAAAALVALQAAALAVVAVVLAVLAVVHSSTRLWAALSIVGFAVLGAVVLWLCARGLVALRPSARSPIVLLELIALPVGFDLGFQGGRLAIALPILVVALAVLVLLFTPTAREALDRIV